MLINKTIFALGATFLFLAVAMIPASANFNQNKFIQSDFEFETVNSVLNRLMDKIETADNYKEILGIIKEFCSTEMFKSLPIVRDILVKILDWVMSRRSLFFNGMDGILGNGILDNKIKNKFVFSFGSYQKRALLKKDERLTLFKQGFAIWRLTDKALLCKGRTLIADRQPFHIKQRVRGSQIGIMFGYSGLFIQAESKLTGNTYVFIMGNARRARSFDLTPFSS